MVAICILYLGSRSRRIGVQRPVSAIQLTISLSSMRPSIKTKPKKLIRSTGLVTWLSGWVFA